MPWNWQLPEWPHFFYDPEPIAPLEQQFLLQIGSSLAYLETIEGEEYNRFRIEILSQEGVQSSKIEGEVLDRESLQCSIRKRFGLPTPQRKLPEKEGRMAELLISVYQSFAQPLTHEMLWGWHKTLFQNAPSLSDIGQYRTFSDPMQIVSDRYDSPQVFFEAPPSAHVFQEMERFVAWFNAPSPSLFPLARAAIAHLYFESIHPFEDGNGRIGRLLVEKVLSQSVGRPTLIAISQVLEKKKKHYYAALERCNRTLEIPHWVEFFAKVILEAHSNSTRLLLFLVEQSKILRSLEGKINERQEKALLRMFAEGPDGFQGGMSADKYMAITKATRPTATRDLADLVKKGGLIKRGRLRHTRYYLPEVPDRDSASH